MSIIISINNNVIIMAIIANMAKAGVMAKINGNIEEMAWQKRQLMAA
jgi:hypothetical protein